VTQVVSDPVIPSVVHQHAEEAGGLWDVRSRLVAGPVTLADLLRLDERITAHLDGLMVAGQHGWDVVLEALSARTSPGAVFSAAYLAVAGRNPASLHRVMQRAAAQPELWNGLVSALEWTSRSESRSGYELGSSDALARELAVAAWGASRNDDDDRVWRLIDDPSPRVRAAVLTAMGDCGYEPGVASCADAVLQSEAVVRASGARAGVLLGDRGRSLQVLGRLDGGRTALLLALQAHTVESAHRLLKGLVSDSKRMALLLSGAGVIGDPIYVPWLIGLMQPPETARLAGGAFSLITGLDLASAGLERERPESLDADLGDSPESADVAVDHGEGLAWPDVDGVRKWWAANSSRFQVGQRYFMGAPVTWEHCVDVLKNGYQRQRILAAHYLCLLRPGTPLFNTSAPAWRQQRLLAQMH